MKLQDYLDGGIYKISQGKYEVRTPHGTGKGSTVAEALKDLANQQLEEKPKKKRKSRISKPNKKSEHDIVIQGHTVVREDPIEVVDLDEAES